jgi:hypothetical protein
MRIYVASSWKNPWQPGVVRLLREAGHLVYDFRHPTDPPYTADLATAKVNDDALFSWKDVDSGCDTWSPDDYRRALQHPLAETAYASDMYALAWCDACVLVLPCGSSSHLELGVAYGQMKKTVVFFPYGMSDLDSIAMGHTMIGSRSGAPCLACKSEMGCLVFTKLRESTRELMVKCADKILINLSELQQWAAS